MQAVILAGGDSSRFVPYNEKHKSLQVVMGKSIIEHTLDSISNTSVDEVIIVCKDPSQFKLVIDESYINTKVKITYCIQSEALGMGDALLKAKEYIHSDFFVLSAHRIDFAQYFNAMIQRKNGEVSAVLVAKKTDDVSQYGSATLDDDTVTSIIEKPEEADKKIGHRLLSTYLFTKGFLEILDDTPLEHYQFEKALSTLCSTGKVKAIHVTDDSFSLKYAWDLLDLKNVLLAKITGTKGENCTIANSAIISQDVVLGNNVTIMENVVIKGPCYIGNNCIIGDFVLLRNGAVIEDDCVIGARSEVKNSIISAGTKIHDGIIEDSVIGKNCRIGAKFCTANVRLDRKLQTVEIKEKSVNTGKKSLGIFMGENVHTGVQVSSMPGLIIGKNSVVGPTTIIMENIENNTLIYSRQTYEIKSTKAE